MKEISFEESRKMMLEMVKDIDAFCRKEGIRYSLAEGSLIGAVRHKGMIPWDDDMDILMPSEDYERFKTTYKSECYTIQNYDYKYNAWFLCIKVVNPSTVVHINETGDEPHGLWVTIFPIDNAPDNDTELKQMEINIRKYQKLFRTRNFYWIKKRGIIKNLMMYIFHFFLLPYSKDYWHNRAEKEIVKYNGIKTKRKGSFAFWMHGPWICPATTFDKYIDADFDGEKFRIIQGYDEYLRCQYGDYMQLPPEEKRVAKHDYSVYWKE